MYTSEGSEESPGEPLLLDNAIKSYGIIFTISHWCLKQEPLDFEKGGLFWEKMKEYIVIAFECNFDPLLPINVKPFFGFLREQRKN